MMSATMTEERQGPGLPGQAIPSIFDISTGNPVADVLMRITPEDGDDGSGRLRDDWPNICVKAAEHVEARRQEIVKQVRGTITSPGYQERIAMAMMMAAIAYRDTLLGKADG